MKTLYDNCKCLSVDGEHLFFCSVRKANSYLKKNIAVKISDDPFVFQLNFKTKGKGQPKQLPKSNVCISCGTKEELTRHHVVPYAIRKNLPSEYKNHRSEEVVPLCRTCHSIYEIEADKLKKKHHKYIRKELEAQAIESRGVKARKTLESHSFFLSSEKIEFLKKEARLERGIEIIKPEILIAKKMEPDKLCKSWNSHFKRWLKKKNSSAKLQK